MLKVINFIIFQISWLVTVYAASVAYPWVGPLFTLVWVGLHIGLFKPKPRCELGLLVFCAAFGYVCDSLLVVAGMIAFPPAAQLGWPSPLWMVALWVNLGMTLNYSLVWLSAYPKLSMVFGFAGGMLAYFGGSKLTALNLIHGASSLLMIAVVWALAMPVLFRVSRYLYAREKSLPGEAVKSP